MQNPAIKLSIVTINFNNDKGLQKTIESVVGQVYPSIEYIVIDGGSSDKSVEIISRHINYISYWVSEKDKGIYHAMNKGILQSTGDYILFLNSGDILLDSSSIQDIFDIPFHEDIIYWNQQSNVTKDVINYPDKLKFSFFFQNTINHQSTLIKRSLFEKVGLYNESLKIVSDWEFYVKAIYLHQATYRKIEGYYTQFDFSEGVSNHPEVYQSLLAERQIVLNKYFFNFLDDYKELATFKKIKYKLSIFKRFKLLLRRMKNKRLRNKSD